MLPPDPDPDDSDPAGPELLTYGIAAWNLEHFHDGATRGFPENGNGGPSYGTRSAADLTRIADIIKTDLRAHILILSEINGQAGLTMSVEMDRLVVDADVEELLGELIQDKSEWINGIDAQGGYTEFSIDTYRFGPLFWYSAPEFGEYGYFPDAFSAEVEISIEFETFISAYGDEDHDGEDGEDGEDDEDPVR